MTHFVESLIILVKDDQNDYIPASENNSQQFSFGDFTLPPKRDPPPRDHYHHSWNHSMSYWNDGSAWNWALEHRYDTNSMNDIGKYKRNASFRPIRTSPLIPGNKNKS